MFTPTTATNKIFELTKRLRVVSGGTSASKTVSILIWLIDYAQMVPHQLISVVSETLPHLKRGAIRDFLNIMTEQKYFDPNRWNKTDFLYLFPNDVRIEFFSADQPGKVRGPRRDVLFVNEANNIPYETFIQLEVRTKKTIWMDFNPVSEFWYYTEIKDKQDHDFMVLTYKDNEALDPNIVQSIESKRDNKNFWQVYGLGQLGESEGKIYTDWKFIDEVPHEARLERYGLDFGYSNDPAAIVAVYYYNGGYILDEVLYQKGYSNRQLADVLLNKERALAIADSAEPKSIDELKSYGVNILPTIKGRDSVTQGIGYVQSQRISVTKRSLNIIKEYRNYLWEIDKNGKITNEPDHTFSHSMDACLIGDTTVITSKGDKLIKEVKTGDLVLTRKGFRSVEWAGITRLNTSVYEVLFSDGSSIKGTYDHLIYTRDRGFIPLTALRYGDIVESCRTNPYFIKDISTSDTQTVPVPQRECISIMETISSIGRYGKITLERFQMVFMYIIKMVTLQTMMYPISSYCLIPTTNVSIGVLNQSLRGSVKYVEQPTKLNTLDYPDSVQTSVSPNQGETRVLMMLKGIVRNVELFLRRISLNRIDIVPTYVQTVTKLPKRLDTYDITVKDIPEFYANGILVHNCRYAFDSLKPKVVDYVAPKHDISNADWSFT